MLLLHVLVAAHMLASAQHVRGAHILNSAKNAFSEEIHASGSGSGASSELQVVGDAQPHHHRGRGRGTNTTDYFGGRRNDQIPSLGGYRRNVALLLLPFEEETDQLQGCITVAIAPQFFITRASCVRDMEKKPLLFIESDDNSRTSMKIKTVTTHPEFGVNLAIVKVEGHRKAQHTSIQPVKLMAYAPSYFLRDDSLSFVSIDNIFNPALAKNPETVDKLVRVPVASCQYNANPSSVNCYAPAKLADRELVYEFGQGMLLHKKQNLVGLPECDGLCSGGMFYSTTHLGKFQSWIDQVTNGGAAWILPPEKKRVAPVAPENEPTIVSLFTSNAALATPACGGTLIAPRYVLTTASCATNNSILVARINHGKRTSGPDGQDDTIGIADVVYHPQYANATALSNDLAIVRLTGPTFYTPTILASDDALNGKDAAPSPSSLCNNPRRSSVDGTIMCVPPALDNDDDEARSLDESFSASGDFDQVSVDLILGATAPSACQQVAIEQWNNAAGDSVFDVPTSGAYYLLGLSTGRNDLTMRIGANQTEQRVCSLGETVIGDDDNNDDDNAAVVVRIATPETIEFIDSISVDHTWRNPHELPNQRSIKMFSESMAMADFSIEYDGALEFQQPPKDQDLGFVVGLRFEKLGQNYCGGSLIAPSYVLTAAHCVGGDRAQFVSVGSHESTGAETELIAVKSANIIVHPLYGKRSRYSYDVAILELESQAYPKPIVLDNSRELDASTYLTLYGYGADSAASTELSKVLRSVDLPYFARDKCNAKFPELDESMFCAGGELARDACTGDSGSPLVRVVSGTPRLVGVVSSGRNGCGTPGVPGVYALVAEMQDFVNSVVAGSKWVDPSKQTTSSIGSSGKTMFGGARTESAVADAEVRSASSGSDGTVLRSSGLNMTDLPFEIINMANGAMEHQLSIVEMATDTPNGLQAALMEFLVGDYNFISGWRPQLDEHWKISFYSTGDVTGLMKIIAQHRTSPLYARKNRFARAAWTSTPNETENSALLSGAVCAMGH